MSIAQPDADILLMDASCLLNWYATGRLREIILAIPWRMGVVDYVLEQEALYVRNPTAAGDREEMSFVELSPLIDDGLVEVVRLQYPEERAAFVDLSAVIDDGQAMTGAIALHRGYAVAIDDRKVRRVLGERSPAIKLISTLEILQKWGATVPVDELRRALRAMRLGANYVPGWRDPLYVWWRDITDDRGA